MPLAQPTPAPAVPLSVVLEEYYVWDRARDSRDRRGAPLPGTPGGLPDGWAVEATPPAPMVLVATQAYLVRRALGGWMVVYRRNKHNDLLCYASTLAALFNDMRDDDYVGLDGSDSLSRWLGRVLVSRYDPTDSAQRAARAMVALHGRAHANIPGEVTASGTSTPGRG